MRLFYIIGLIITLISINGCAPKPGSPEAALKIKKDAIEKQQQKVEKTVSKVPKWCLKLPKSNFALYRCGFGESTNMNMSRNRAILDAKRLLADAIDSEISSRMDDFLKSTGLSSNEQIKQASEIVTKNTTVEAKLIGYKQINTEVISMHGKYQFYVLLEYPIGQANQALLDQIKNNEILSTQKDADKAMAELEKEIEKRRKK